MNEIEIKRAIREIGIALNLTHNCVVTDKPDAQPDPHSWRADHSKELDLLKGLEKQLLGSVNG